jgi:hypothetical protein
MSSYRSNAARARQGVCNSRRRGSRPARDRAHDEWMHRQRNPRGLDSTAEYFRRHPDASCRIIATPYCGGKFWNIAFIPRRGPVVELLAEQVRNILAERCPKGSLLERLTHLVEWLGAYGALPARVR